MRALLLAALLCGAAGAQSIIDYAVTPAIVGAFAPGIACYHYAQHPTAGQVQVACYLNGILIFNGVMTVSANQAFACAAISPSFNLAWAFVPDALPAIKFQIAAQAKITGPPLFFAAPIQSSPGVAALGGIF